jgi:bifunctional non-homologous end joining protein LigD
MAPFKKRASRASPVGFIEPCLPSAADRIPIRGEWIHEIKYDGYRLMALRDGAGLRLLTRRANDWTAHFPLVANAVGALNCRSCLIDGEVVSCDESGLPVFKLLRQRRSAKHLYAFDLLELNGRDLRQEPIEIRKDLLTRLIGADGPGLMLGRAIEEPPEIVFEHICVLGLEGIVSKRLGSRYESGRSLLWVKTRNPNAPAIIRLSEEGWN